MKRQDVEIRTMAIALEFIDLVVPISLIEKKYPGGWARCQKDYERQIGSRMWFDDHLLRDGAMSGRDIEYLPQNWTVHGFEPTGDCDGELFWKDCCVVESMLGGLSLPCDWLEFGPGGQSAYLKGTEPGEVIAWYGEVNG